MFDPGPTFARTLISCLCGLALAVPAAAQQRPRIVRAAQVQPLRLAPPQAEQAALETVAVSRLPLAEQDNMAFGVGLFSVGGHFVRERGARGREPLIDTGGRQSRVAAVGFSLRF